MERRQTSEREDGRVQQALDRRQARDDAIEALIKEGWEKLRPAWERLYAIETANQRRVIEAFQQCGVRSFHLQSGTGYGYDDPAREITEAVYASVFQGEAAIVRPRSLRARTRPGSASTPCCETATTC